MILTENYSPGVLSVLPIIYVAWADGILSPSELRHIQEKIRAFDFLTEEDKTLVSSWCDPMSPPEEFEFKSWIDALDKHGQNLNIEARRNLADVGIKFAESLTTGNMRRMWLSHKTRESLEGLEKALGVHNPESFKLLLNKFSNGKALQAVDDAFPLNELFNYLEGDDKELKNRLRALLTDPLFEKKHIATKEEYRKITLERCRMLAKQGYGLIHLPESIGGKNDMRSYACIFEVLGHHDISLGIKFGVQFGLYALTIANLGGPGHHRSFLPKAASLEEAGCFAMTESGHGSNVRGLETTAYYDENSQTFTINTPRASAAKEYIGNTLDAHMSVVFAQLIVRGEHHGVHAFVVPLTDSAGNELPGIRKEDCGQKMGLNGVDNGRLYFSNVQIPRGNLLDKYGKVSEDGVYSSQIKNQNKRFFIMLSSLVGGRVCVARAGISAAKNALTIAIKYAHERRQFAANEKDEELLLMDYPSHQRRLLPHLAGSYAYHFALKELTEDLVTGKKGSKKLESLAAGLKAKATWLATSAIQECREACGGAGYIHENGLVQLKADTDIFTTFEGDNTVLMQLVSKALLSEFQKHFHEEGFRAVMKFISKRINTELTEKNLYIKRITNSGQLLDQNFHREAFRFREKHLLFTSSQRMRKYLKKRIDAHSAFLRCQTHLIELAHAHIDRIVLKSFQRAIKSAPMSLHEDLTKIYNVFAVGVLYENRAYFLEHNYMEGSKTKALERVYSHTLREMRESSLHYVEAFKIPKGFLASKLVE